MRKSICSLLLFGLPCFMCTCIGQSFSATDKALAGLHQKGLFSGAVLLAAKGKILYRKDVGYQDSSRTIPISSSTSFELASVSKIFTAIMVLQLVEEGKLKLNTPIDEFVPGFVVRDSGHITIHHLLPTLQVYRILLALTTHMRHGQKKIFLKACSKHPFFSPPEASLRMRPLPMCYYGLS